MRAFLFPRLLWKEYRVLRGYWLSLAVLGVTLGWIFFQFATDATSKFFPLAWAMAAFFALGGGATIFAIEREERTIEYLRGLPASWSRLFLGKLALLLGGTALLWAVISAVGSAMVGRELWMLRADDWVMMTVGAVATLQVIAWGLFFSLLQTRPLVAALLAAAATFASFFLAPLFADLGHDVFPGWQRPGRPELLPHAIATVGVYLVDYALARRWLLGSARRPYALRIARARDMRRLWWQQARQSGLTLGVLLALGVLLPAASWSSVGCDSPAVVPIATLIFALLGSCVFLADQEGRHFRYYAERGVDPRRLWLARQLFWASPALALMVCYLLAHILLLAVVESESPKYDHMPSRLRLIFNYAWFGIDLGDPYRQLNRTWHLGWLTRLPGYLLWSALAFGSGQLCSMFLRSGLLAAVFGVVMAGLLVGWAAFMEFLELSWLLTVAPLVIALFVSTWLRAPDWLTERTEWRPRLRAAWVLALPMAAVLVGTCVYRAYEAPAPAVQIVPRRMAMPSGGAEARRTAELYNRAAELLSGEASAAAFPDLRSDTSTTLNGSQIAWLRANQEPLALVLEAAARPDCAFGRSPRVEGLGLLRLLHLGRLVVLSARQLEDEGELDAAWARYQAGLSVARHFHQQPGLFGEEYGNAVERMVFDRLFYWAAHQEQTPDGIRAAVDHLEKLGTLRPMAEQVLEEYGDLASRLFGAGESWSRPGEPAILSPVLARWMPWELTRSKRVLALLAQLDLGDVEAAESALAGQRQPAHAWHYEDPYLRIKAESLVKTSLFFGLEGRDDRFDGFSRSLVDSRRQAVANRRAARLVLAALAWRLDHDELPETLAELEENGSARAPVDPYTNGPFGYARFGLRASVESSNLPRVARETPLLYSPGTARHPVEYMREQFNRLRRESEDDERAASDSSNDAVESLPGLLFPIPALKR